MLKEYHFYLFGQNLTSQTGGQLYSDTYPYAIVFSGFAYNQDHSLKDVPIFETFWCLIWTAF